jgi:hypothetical protein
MLSLLSLLAACGTEPEEVPAGTCDSDGSSAAFVMSVLHFNGLEDDGSAWGFDLDGLVSETGDATGCGKADLVDPEGHTGIDNAFAGLMPVIANTEAAAIPGLVQDAVDSGQLLLVVEITGLDDFENDDCVTVTITQAVGTPMLGTNGVLLDGQTFDRDPDYPSVVVHDASIVNGRLVARGLAIRLSLQVLDAEIALDIPDGALQVDLSPDGTRATGHLGGGFSIDYLMTVVDGNGVDDSLTELLRGLLPAVADLDGDEGECSYLSVDFHYDAVPVFFFE